MYSGKLMYPEECMYRRVHVPGRVYTQEGGCTWGMGVPRSVCAPRRAPVPRRVCLLSRQCVPRRYMPNAKPISASNPVISTANSQVDAPGTGPGSASQASRGAPCTEHILGSSVRCRTWTLPPAKGPADTRARSSLSSSGPTSHQGLDYAHSFHILKSPYPNKPQDFHQNPLTSHTDPHSRPSPSLKCQKALVSPSALPSC